MGSKKPLIDPRPLYNASQAGSQLSYVLLTLVYHFKDFSMYLRGRLWAPILIQKKLIFPQFDKKNSQSENKFQYF